MTTEPPASAAPTPLCDAVGTNGGFYRSKEQGWYVPITFARQLERTNAELLWILSQLMGALPTRRDWLDPILEKRANAAIERAAKGAG